MPTDSRQIGTGRSSLAMKHELCKWSPEGKTLSGETLTFGSSVAAISRWSRTLIKTAVRTRQRITHHLALAPPPLHLVSLRRSVNVSVAVPRRHAKRLSLYEEDVFLDWHQYVVARSFCCQLTMDWDDGGKGILGIWKRKQIWRLGQWRKLNEKQNVT